MPEKKDSLGDRLKTNYENRTRYSLPRRTYLIIRVDGKAFRTYTKGCNRPYDRALMADMDRTAVALCEQISGAQMAFVQSDEISVLVTDFDNQQTEGWFDNNLQKMCSISASIATAHFNSYRTLRRAIDSSEKMRFDVPLAYFDSRVFQIPDRTEIYNYFLWRQQDATRNSIIMLAQAHFNHTELHGASCADIQDMLMIQKNINWNDEPVGFKRGRCVVKVTEIKDVTYCDKRTKEEKTVTGVERHSWKSVEPPIFSKDKDWILGCIPDRDSGFNGDLE